MPKIITTKERIDRLTKELAKLKAENKSIISELKKERRALKAKVSYIDNKLLSTDNPDIKKLKEENLSLKSEMEDIRTTTEKYYRDKYDTNLSISALQVQLDRSNRRQKEIVNELAQHIATCQKYIQEPADKERLERFNNGEMYDEKKRLFFSDKNLFIRYNPNNGRILDEFDILVLEKNFKYNADYMFAYSDFHNFIVYKRNYTEEELDAIIYKKGMELLPLYKDYII